LYTQFPTTIGSKFISFSLKVDYEGKIDDDNNQITAEHESQQNLPQPTIDFSSIDSNPMEYLSGGFGQPPYVQKKYNNPKPYYVHQGPAAYHPDYFGQNF
jgi:hypothetical protein